MASKYPTTPSRPVATLPHSIVTRTQIRMTLITTLNQILTVWPALVMAVENSFGGIETRDKAEWLREVLADYILSKKLLDVDDLENFILSVMETEFNTLVEDGSCSKLCETVLRVYRAIQMNDAVRVEQILSPFRLLVKSKVPMEQPVTHQDTDMSTDDIKGDTGVSLTPSVTIRCDEDMEVADEWQIVTRSKKKKKSTTLLYTPQN